MNRGSAPADRLAAGLTVAATDTSGKYVSALDIVNGVLILTFGHESNAAIQSMTLTMTPYETPERGIAWRCGTAAVPPGGVLLGTGSAHSRNLYGSDGTRSVPAHLVQTVVALVSRRTAL